jgi:N utilization substance protein A
MNSEDLLRMIDVIHRDKDIPKEVIFLGLEDALAVGVRKRLGAGEDLIVTIDRQSGEILVEDEEEEYEMEMGELGRIAAQAI